MVAGNNSRNGFWAKSFFWYPLQDGSVAGLAGFWSKNMGEKYFQKFGPKNMGEKYF